MSVKITYFVHGTTIDNEKDLSTGWLGGELSEKGIKQAKELGDLVADKNFDVIFCSDLKRAVDSAELGFASKYKIIPDVRLRECNYGDFNGKPSEFKDNKMQEFIVRAYPNGESYQDVEKRMADFLEFLKKNYAGKHVALLAHEGPQLALDVLLGNKTWEQAISDNWRNTHSWQPGWEYGIN
ncbi:MAG: histidine phosphatase family protein [Patescibacteria group bacterium]|nr:histidine phosphatase family protein [Patescibacteria group bacterium]